MMDDGKGEIPPDLAGRELLDYEELLGAAEPVDFRVTTRTRPPACATRAGPPAIRRAWCTATGARSCTPSASSPPTRSGPRESDRIIPVVPMFHANAWGLADAGVAAGADLVMPGPDLSGKALADLIVEEKVTVAAGVPTIWMQVLPELKGRDTSSLRAIPCGGSAVPRPVGGLPRANSGCRSSTRGA